MDAFLPYIQQLIANLFGNTGDVAGAASKVVGGLDMAGLVALAAALGWASGIRLYLVVFITGAAGMLGWLPLPTGLHVLQHPVMLSASGFMLFVEFFADKWDISQSDMADRLITILKFPDWKSLIKEELNRYGINDSEIKKQFNI